MGYQLVVYCFDDNFSFPSFFLGGRSDRSAPGSQGEGIFQGLKRCRQVRNNFRKLCLMKIMKSVSFPPQMSINQEAVREKEMCMECIDKICEGMLC